MKHSFFSSLYYDLLDLVLKQLITCEESNSDLHITFLLRVLKVIFKFYDQMYN